MKWFKFSWLERSSIDNQWTVCVEYMRFNSPKEARKHVANDVRGALNNYQCDGYASREAVQGYFSDKILSTDSMWDIINNPIYYGKN